VNQIERSNKIFRVLRLLKLLKLLRTFRLPRSMVAAKSSSKDGNEEQHSFGRFVLVLEKYDETLEERLERNAVSGRDVQEVRTYLHGAAECLAAMAKTGRIHGNVSPASFALGQGRELLLHDFDYSVKVGDKLIGRECATATAPPERLQLEFAQKAVHKLQELQPKPRPEPGPEPEPEPEHACPAPGRSILLPTAPSRRREFRRFRRSALSSLKADISYDIWSFGVMVYKLCEGKGLAHFYNEGHGELVNEDDQAEIANNWQNRKLEVTSRISTGRDDKTLDAARDLALWCLQERLERRPKNFEQILEHPFLNPEQTTTREFKPAGFKVHYPKQATRRFGGTDEERATKLHRAVEDGDMTAARDILGRGGVPADVPVPASGIITPLHRAARKGEPQMLQLLLDEGADVNAKSQYGYTCLHWAVVYGRQEILEKLLKHPDCDPALTNDRGMTAWAMARAVSKGGLLHSAFETISRGKTSDHTFPTQVREKLQSERERFEKRPDVADNFRDNIELMSERFDLWAVEVGSFTLWVEVAEGGFGKVFKVSGVSPAIQVSNAGITRRFSEVAVKVPKEIGVDELVSEVESLSLLTHVNVVQILGMFQGPSKNNVKEDWKMAMEFCPTDLKNMLYGTPPSKSDENGSVALVTTNCATSEYRDYSVKLMFEFAQQIVDGLVYIHAEGKPHLDLKPENILLSKDESEDWMHKAGTPWVCKIGDFGMDLTSSSADTGKAGLRRSTSRSTSITRSLSASDEISTTRTEIEHDETKPYGTWEYMPPECTPTKGKCDDGQKREIRKQKRAKYGQPGAHSDIFSFGMMFWEMVQRARPSDVTAGFTIQENNIMVKGVQTTNMVLVAERLLSGERPRPPVDCPAVYYCLMQSCWVHAPENRPTAATVATMLQRIQETEGAVNLPAPEATDPYDDFLQKLNLQDKKEELAEYLADGSELTELMQMDEDDLSDDIFDEALGLDDATKEAFRAALQELKGGGNWQETAAYMAEKAREQLEVMLGAPADGEVARARAKAAEAEAVLQATLQQTKKEGEGTQAELQRSKAELQVAKAELQLHKARSDHQLQLHTARSDHEVRTLKAELSEAKQVATLLESKVGEEVKVMAKVAATITSDRERRGSVKAAEEMDSLSGKEGLQAKKRRAFLKTRASTRILISTDKVTQEDVQATTERLASLGSVAEDGEPEPDSDSDSDS
jgi:serine/threonine protein kinase